MEATQPSEATGDDLWRRLMYRWFIQYNPLYLISATLVLVGVIVLSQAFSGGGTLAQLGITAIAEVYAWALIGGAALLYRIHMRRPAVMLTLLAALYQCDLTLHTETCVHLGVAGAMGTGVWLVSFIGKLRVLAWAMKVRVSRSAKAVMIGGGLLVALGPWVLRLLDGPAASSVLALAVFSLFAAGLWTHRHLETPEASRGWPATVARRSRRSIWIGWASMVAVHVGFWTSQHRGLDPSVFVPVAVLLGTRWATRESTVWLIVGGTLAGVGLGMPELMSLTAVMAAATLTLRALRQPSSEQLPEPRDTTATDDVYRVDATEVPSVPPPPPRVRLRFVFSELEARRRLLTGAAGCLYLALWTWGWSGGAWPAHVAWLDLLLAAATIALWARARLVVPLVLPVASSLHLLLSLRVISAPASALEWGVACVGVGFALLLLSLVASVRWRHRAVSLARSASIASPSPDESVSSVPAMASALGGPAQ